MKKKLLALLLVLAMLVTMLAACGGNPPPDNGDEGGGNEGGGNEGGGNEGGGNEGGGNEGGGNEGGGNEGGGNEGGGNEGEDGHVHTFMETWQFDEFAHWRISTCGHDVKADEEEHSFDGSRCEVCEMQDPDFVYDYTIEWDETEIYMQISRNDNSDELPPSSERFLAGNVDTPQLIDDNIADRNAAAIAATNVRPVFSYLEDTDEYNWAQNMEHIYTSVNSNSATRPDVYVNFVYDMMAASLQKCFANLYSTAMDVDTAYAGVNNFQFRDQSYKDTGTGYMVDYMKEMSLSKHRIYLLASDYFIDMVRSFLVVPVNETLLKTVPVTNEEGQYNTDRNGDGVYDLSDFYGMVWDGDWNYETVAAYSAAIYEDSGKGTDNAAATGNLEDTLVFALGAASGLPASGMLYTSSITIIKRTYNEGIADYEYAYNDEEKQLLFDFCDNLSSLFSTKGVVAVGGHAGVDYGTYGSTDLTAIRNRFAENRILFGGVICLGSLESGEYTTMLANDYSFGVVPVPLYRAVNPTTGKADPYLTQIHNLGHIAAISRSTGEFAQCTAYLDYQSTHSSAILNDYYQYTICEELAGGNPDTVQMLTYIRYNVRTAFDKAYEDALAEYNSTKEYQDPIKNKWHSLIKDNAFCYTGSDMSSSYTEWYDDKIAWLDSMRETFETLPE